MTVRRRSLVRTLAGGLLLGLAGCSGQEGTEPTPSTVAGTDDPTSPPTGNGATTRSPTGATTATPTRGVVTPTPTHGTTSTDGTTPTPSPTTTVTETTELRRRVREVGLSVRDSVLAVAVSGRDDPTRITDTAWYYAGDVAVLTASALDGGGTVSAWTVDGRGIDAEPVGTTGPPDERTDDVAAVRTGATGPALARGSADDLAPGDVLVQVAHYFLLGEWVVGFGRFRGWTDDRERFRSTVPFFGKFGRAYGSPVVTLDGDVVGMTVGEVLARDPPSTATPPAPAPTDVHRNGPVYELAEHEPIGDVRDHVGERVG